MIVVTFVAMPELLPRVALKIYSAAVLLASSPAARDILTTEVSKVELPVWLDIRFVAFVLGVAVCETAVCINTPIVKTDDITINANKVNPTKNLLFV